LKNRSKSGWAVAWAVACLSLLFLVQLSYANEEFGGLGMVVAQLYDEEVENGRGDIAVLVVLPKGPAAKAGIKAGDTITHIDGASVSGKAFDEIVTAELRGPIGMSSRLTVKRPLKVKPISFVLKRVSIAPPPETP
jgi:carboxyl-terminal processing protease